MDETKRMTDMDRWVLAITAVIALALIAGSVVTGNEIYLAALGSLGFLVVIYFVFLR